MQTTSLEPIAVGLSLGLTAGLSPGPLSTLVISSTLQRGFAAGARVAAAPLVTDLPIVIAALWVSSAVPDGFLSIMSLVGGLFVIYIGVSTVRESTRPLDLQPMEGAVTQDLLRGALVNLLSPHPWLFWFGIGGPTVVSAQRTHGLLAAGFLVVFYLGLVGSKVILAALVARGRQALVAGPWYRRVLAACGVLLVGLGLALAARGAGDLSLGQAT
ncbi:MAG: LysE family transporter [Acidobacteriota bacterium]